MTQYLLSIYQPAGEPPPPDVLDEVMRRLDEVNQQIKDAGAWVFAGGLHPANTATVVKESGGEVLTTDGPFAETKEQLGGYYLLDCEDLDDALAWAKRIPSPGGSVEVRPVMDYEAAGSQVHTNRAEAEAAR